MLKISIITVTLNSEKTILKCIDSLGMQSYQQIEHIIVDGKSSDLTLSIIKKNKLPNTQVISEKDSGIYEAMNKGIDYATGEVVAFLNSDDFYTDPSVLANVMNEFNNNNIDFVHGKVAIVNEKGRIVRVNGGKKNVNNYSILGLHCPHPAFFVKTKYLKQMNPPFDTNFKLAADIKQQLILIYRMELSGQYLDCVTTQQLLGGASTKNIFSYLKGWNESRMSYNEVFRYGGLIFSTLKILTKISSFKFFN